jgi:hypothetical protein
MFILCLYKNNVLLHAKLANIFFFDSIPKPHEFVEYQLQSGFDVSSIVSDLNSLLPQLAGFIDQFNNVVNQSGLNIITDSNGSMSMDVPYDMTDQDADKLSKRIHIIDRLINNRSNSISDLFQKGLDFESKLKANNPGYVSELTDHIAQFKKLKASYKH